MLGQMLAGEGVRLAVLNACRGGAGGGQAASVAGALVRAGIPAVIAMQADITSGRLRRLRRPSTTRSPSGRAWTGR